MTGARLNPAGLSERRRRTDRVARWLFLAAAVVGVVLLVVLLWGIAGRGLPALSWRFLTSPPSRFPSRAGVLTPLVGTVWIGLLTIPLAMPIGLATAIYLEEYAARSRLARFVQLNIANLAGVPSIVYGLLGLTVFVRGLMLGRSVLAGALTMALLVLPVIIIASQEAIRAVPQTLRHASLALGATRWQTVRRVVLPTALPSILTGSILALSRVLGETAPLIMIGALTYIAFVPASPLDPFTVLPIQIFNWTSRPQEEFRTLAAAAILVLLAILLSLNGVAIWLRNRYQKKADW